MATANVPRPAENVLKQGYLKKCVQTNDIIPSAPKQITKNIKQKLEPNRWYVFLVRNRKPFLEFYDKEESIFTGPPIHSYDLSTFQSISYTMGRTNTNYSFCIVLAESTIELTAPSRTHMLDWCRCLDNNLRNLGFKSKHPKDDHQYTEFPVKSDYKPRHTAIDTEMSLEDKLVQNTQLKSLDDEDNDYDDATVLDGVLGAEGGEPTLPLRPPPRKPKKNVGQEDVFVDFSSVRREDAYSNFNGQNQPVGEDEKHLFETDTESASDDDIENKTKDSHEEGMKRKENSEVFMRSKDSGGGGVGDDGDDEGGDRCTSLPVTLHSTPLESDTSEDSDFLSVSFFMRNRLKEANEAQKEAVPPLPSRKDPPKSQTMPKNFVPQGGEFLKPSKPPRRSVSPTLDQLGTAPAVPERQSSSVSDTDNGASKADSEIVVIDDSMEWYAVPRNTRIQSTGTTVSNPKTCDKVHVDSDNVVGEYETLVQTNHTAIVKARKVDSKTEVAEVTDNLYGATWECSSARRHSLDVDDDCCGKRKSDEAGASGEKQLVKKQDESDDDCCSKSKSNGFLVDLAEGDCEKKLRPKAKEPVPMERDSSNSHSSKQKQKGLFSKLLQRKSKEIELPERLVVNLPSHSLEGACGEDNQGISENFYSDFPSPTNPMPPHLDSDILKLSRENGSSSGEPFSPIALPKRDFTQHPVKKSDVSKPICDSNDLLLDPVQGFSQDAYEPIDVSRSAQGANNQVSNGKLSPSFKTKPVRSPHGAECAFPFDDAPVAPPRRSRKSDKSTKDDAESPKVERRECTRSPVIPKKRQTVTAAAYSSNREPAVPPRLHSIGADSSKSEQPPELPPPPRPRTITRAVSDATGPVRPKSMHLSSWQQSVSQMNAVTVMNLKQNQVEILRSEIMSSGGLVKVISKVHFQSGLALVECFGKIWIAGWDVKKFPRLYDKFHIGDQLQAINDVQVTDIAFANKLVKNVKAEKIEITIRRLPLAKVFAIQRSAEGESLGLKREGGTAEIIYIDPLGLAHKHGLNKKATTMDGAGQCNWTLTEVNMRSLNLFFKDQEIEHLLLAVGRDISIVVQPSDFIKELKKQLKKLKGYKDFLIH